MVSWNFETNAIGGRKVTLSQTRDQVDRDLVQLTISSVRPDEKPSEMLLNEQDVLVLMECALTRLRFNLKKRKKGK